MTDAALSPATGSESVLFEFDLEQLPALVDQTTAVPPGFTFEVVAKIPAGDRAATYRLEQLWAMARGWLAEPRPFTPDLDRHLIEDYATTEEGFSVLARDGQGTVVGIHGAEARAPGVGATRYLVVEPTVRGQGLGRCLKAWQLKAASDVGWHLLQCDLPGDDAAIGVRSMNGAMGGRRVAAFAMTPQPAARPEPA